MTATHVITAIRAHLGQPVMAVDEADSAVAPSSRSIAKLDLTRLAKLAEMLKWEASQVGTIPSNYPALVNLVMQAIHRLLPWYTRPIRNFSRVCAEQTDEITYQIAVLANAQSEILSRLEQLESQQHTHQ